MNHGSRIMQKESKQEHYSNTFRYPRWIPSTLNRLPIKSNSTGIWMARKHTLNPTLSPASLHDRSSWELIAWKPPSRSTWSQQSCKCDSYDTENRCCLYVFYSQFKQYFEFRFVGCMLAIRLDLVYLSLSICLFIYVYTHPEFEDYLLSHVDWLSFCKGTIHIPSIWHHPNNRNFATLMHLDAINAS